MKQTLYRTFSFVYGYSVSLYSIGLAHFNGSVNIRADNKRLKGQFLIWELLSPLTLPIAMGKHWDVALAVASQRDRRRKCAENERVKWGWRMLRSFYTLHVAQPGLIKTVMSREEGRGEEGLPVLIALSNCAPSLPSYRVFSPIWN